MSARAFLFAFESLSENNIIIETESVIEIASKVIADADIRGLNFLTQYIRKYGSKKHYLAYMFFYKHCTYKHI